MALELANLTIPVSVDDSAITTGLSAALSEIQAFAEEQISVFQAASDEIAASAQASADAATQAVLAATQAQEAAWQALADAQVSRAEDVSAAVQSALDEQTAAVIAAVDEQSAAYDGQLASVQAMLDEQVGAYENAFDEEVAAYAAAQDQMTAELAAANADRLGMIQAAAAANYTASNEVDLPNVGGALGRVGSGVSGAAGGIAGAAADLGAQGGRYDTGVAAVAVGVGLAGIDQYVKYNNELTKVKALTSASAADVANLNTQILALGPTVGKSPTELVKALYFIESGGINGANAMKVLTEAAKESASGMGSTADDANVLTLALNAYSKSGLDAKTASDELTEAVTEGHLKPELLANSLGKVLGMASSLNVSFPELLANVATLTRTSGNPAFAVTSFTGVITALEKLKAPTKLQTEALAQLGLTSGQVADDMKNKGLKGTLEDINTAYNTLAATGADADAPLLRLFPNRQAFRDVLGTVADQGTAYTDILGKITSSTAGAGKTQQAFAITSQSLGQELRQARAEVDELAISLGQKLAPYASAALKEILGFAHELGENKTLAHELGVVLETVVVAGLLRVAGGFVKVAAAMALSPWTWVAAGLVGIVAEYKHLDDTSASWHKRLSALPNDADGVWKSLEHGTSLAPGLTKLFGDLGLKPAWAKTLGSTADELVGVARRGINGFEDLAEKSWPEIEKVGGSIFNFGKSVLDTVVGWAENNPQAIGRVVKSFESFGGSVEKTFNEATTWIHNHKAELDKWGHELADILATASEVVAGVAKLFSMELPTGLSLGGAAFGRLLTVVGGVMHTIRDLMSAETDLMNGHWLAGAHDLLKAGESMFGGLAKLFDQQTGGLLGTFEKWLGNMITGVIHFGGDVIDWFEGLPGDIEHIFDDAGSWLLDAGGRVLKGFITGIENEIPGLKESLGWITNNLPSWKGPADKDAVLLRPAAKLIMGGFNDELWTQFATVKRSLSDMTDLIALRGDTTGAIADRITGSASVARASALATTAGVAASAGTAGHQITYAPTFQVAAGAGVTKADVQEVVDESHGKFVDTMTNLIKTG